jgi:hypothetical protein
MDLRPQPEWSLFFLQNQPLFHLNLGPRLGVREAATQLAPTPHQDQHINLSKGQLTYLIN